MTRKNGTKPSMEKEAELADLKLVPKSEEETAKEAKPEKPYKPDDDEIADELVHIWNGNFRYFRNLWHRYTAGYWQPLTRGISGDVIRMVKSKRFLGVKPSKTKCQSVEWFCQQELGLEDESVVDNEPDYLNLKNGLFNLKTNKLEKHLRSKYITCQAAFSHDEGATAPTFLKWLKSMLVTPDGKPDTQLYYLVLEAMGYTLTADMSHRVSFWLVGPTGSGKSTLINIMIALMQDYHVVIDLNELGTNRFMLSMAAGKRLITFGESNANLKLADGLYKTLVSNDAIVADVKNHDPITFKPQAKIWWGMNNLPYVADRSGAVDSRVIILPFRRQIPREQWDLTLEDRIKRDELPGVFNLALVGLQRLRHAGHFTKVEQVEAEKNEYQQSNDIYATFLADDEWCKPDGKTPPTPLYRAFAAWARENGINHYVTSVTIKREWLRLGLKYTHSGSRFYEGIGLTEYAKSKAI